VKTHAAEFHVDPNVSPCSVNPRAVTLSTRWQFGRPRPTRRPTWRLLLPFYAPCDNVADSVRRGGASKSMQALLGVGEKLDRPTEARLWKFHR